MQTAILTLHVIVCVVLVILVLLQAGREGMGVIFGGGGNSSVFGSAGAGGILVKLTTVLAVLFIATSLFYNIITSTGRDTGSSILDVRFGDEMTPAPAPVTTAPAETEATQASGASTEAAGDESSPGETGATPASDAPTNESSPVTENTPAPETAADTPALGGDDAVSTPEASEGKSTPAS